MIEEQTESARKIEEAKRSQRPGPDSMHIKVYSPFKTYFDNEGTSITGQNATGPFDVLPRHHNFMTLLTPCELVICSPRGEQRIRISGGLMHVKADRVTVFLDI
jgi:F0F1-type ATP synthase epsilon subunit